MAPSTPVRPGWLCSFFRLESRSYLQLTQLCGHACAEVFEHLLDLDPNIQFISFTLCEAWLSLYFHTASTYCCKKQWFPSIMLLLCWLGLLNEPWFLIFGNGTCCSHGHRSSCPGDSGSPRPFKRCSGFNSPLPLSRNMPSRSLQTHR